MAEEKSGGFFKRVLGRFGGGKETPKPEPAVEEIPPRPAPQAPPENDAAKPAKTRKRATEPKKAAAPKKPTPKKAPAARKPAKKPPVKRTKAEKPVEKPPAEKPRAEKLPAAKAEKKVVAKKATPKKPAKSPAPQQLKPKPTPAAKSPGQPNKPALAPAAIAEIEPESEKKPEKKGWFARLKNGLTRSSTQLTENIAAVFTKRKLDEETLQDLEDVLIQADLGVETAMNIAEEVARGRFNKEISDREIREILGAEVAKVLEPVATPLVVDAGHEPHIILVVGVNGTGKTTTIGKLAAKLRGEGKTVMLAAGDTFRAAAIDQLKIWGERVGASVVAGNVGADSSGLAFDAIRDARAEGVDVLLIDTAGRLQNQANLMAELEKIRRVIGKQDESAPHDVLLVLDATTGQNALQQVEIFQKVAGVTGLVMTKLDGTARGGILVAISAKYQLPVHAIGVGETVEDLQPFEAIQFANAIAGLDGAEFEKPEMDENAA